jgi:hypothetical protein
MEMTRRRSSRQEQTKIYVVKTNTGLHPSCAQIKENEISCAHTTLGRGKKFIQNLDHKSWRDQGFDDRTVCLVCEHNNDPSGL